VYYQLVSIADAGRSGATAAVVKCPLARLGVEWEADKLEREEVLDG